MAAMATSPMRLNGGPMHLNGLEWLRALVKSLLLSNETDLVRSLLGRRSVIMTKIGRESRLDVPPALLSLVNCR